MSEATETPVADDEVVTDRLFQGRLALRQFRRGHRAGTDAVLLAAAAGIDAGERFVDVGAGIGTVGLAMALAQPQCTGVLFERDPDVARLALDNVQANAMSQRLTVTAGDIFKAADQANLASSADLVVSNPPFYQPGTQRPSTDARRRSAHMLSDAAGAASPTHEDWVRACLRLLGPKGRLLLIHRPDALAPILNTMQRRLGGLVLKSVHPRRDAPAIRILVGGLAGSRAPLVIQPALVLHDHAGQFTAEAEALHAGEPMHFWQQKSRPKGRLFRQETSA